MHIHVLALPSPTLYANYQSFCTCVVLSGGCLGGSWDDVFMGEAWCLGDPCCALTLVSSVFPASVSHFPNSQSGNDTDDFTWEEALGRSSGKLAATSCGTEQQRNWVKYSSFPTQRGEKPFPLSTGFCAASTSKAVAGTHSRGQFTRDCAVHSITMLGTGEVPDPTFLLQRANLGVQDRWEDKKDEASLALPRMRESLSKICKTTRLGSFLFAEHQTGLKRHFSAHSTRKNIPGKSL